MLFSLFSLVSLACAGSAHTNSQVPLRSTDSQITLTAPDRPLVWGDFNVIHTTDTHGWLLGHQKLVWPEPNYNGDLGDFASFVSHMQHIAEIKDLDLLLVDSGDIHDGTGLTDGYPTGGINGHVSSKCLLELPYDLMTIGNHDITNYTVAYDVHTNFAPYMKGRYLTSNVEIKIFNDGEGRFVPIGNRFVKFKTRKGRRVTALGVLFNFEGGAKHTRVQTVADMVEKSKDNEEQTWFEAAIEEEPDVFVLVGHMPVGKSDIQNKWHLVFDAIRDKYRDTPILIFGGHNHNRDCEQYDVRSLALQSGRYMETIGWMSANLGEPKKEPEEDPKEDPKEDPEPITFTRRYMDANRVTYQYHTYTNDTNFDTEKGRAISDGLKQLAIDFDLSYVYGCAPQTYKWYHKYPGEGSLLTLFIEHAAPYALKKTNPIVDETNSIVIANSMVLRYDVFKGPFTKNDQFTASPYANKFVYVSNIEAGIAKQVVGKLNERKKGSLVNNELWGGSTSDLMPGYLTKDGCEDKGLGKGDDVKHAPISTDYEIPKYISSVLPSTVQDDEPVNIVFFARMQETVLGILQNSLMDVGKNEKIETQELDTTSNQVLGIYAEGCWREQPDDLCTR